MNHAGVNVRNSKLLGKYCQRMQRNKHTLDHISEGGMKEID